MPPATYPDLFTFYCIEGYENQSAEETANEIVAWAKQIESMPSDERENPLGSQLACQFIRVLENHMEQGENARCEISLDGADCFGNARPYDAAMLESFNITLCQDPYIAMKSWIGLNQVEDALEEMRQLSSHPFFKEDQNLTKVILLLQKAVCHGKQHGACAVIATLRSYYAY